MLFQKLEQDRQWTIAQVASPLNSNTYMIRNLNGAALHMRPGGEISTEKVNKGAHEKVCSSHITYTHNIYVAGTVGRSGVREREMHY